jgi:aminoglycoside phosphotransferase family enzyme/predicted kinase
MPSATLRRLDDEPPALQPAEIVRAVFTHPVAQIAVRETCLSRIVLTGPFAYKIRKPVRFDFIDATRLADRRRLCEEELRLNRELAPDLYLDVVPIARTAAGIFVNGPGEVIDYAVRMRQFAASDELPQRVASGEVSPAEILTLADSLAQFHLRTARVPSARDEAVTHTRGTVLGNLAQLIAGLAECGVPSGLDHIVDWLHDTAASLETIFEQRERDGSIRDCHGDLHLANIVRHDGQLVPFDRLEFDAALRTIDVIDDIAFLVMDLSSHGRDDLAALLLSRYLEVTGDYEGLRLLRFYAVHRALVRAKVDALTAAQIPEHATELFERMRNRIATAKRWASSPTPSLILMHGPSGAGKSWLSAQLVGPLAAIRIRSDIERKRLDPDLRDARALHAPAMNHRTYARVSDCAEHCLRGGFNAIVDAACLDVRDRELLRNVATRSAAHWSIINCTAIPEVLAARVALRARNGDDVSDADATVVEAQLRNLQPLSAAERAHAVHVNTDAPYPVHGVLVACGGVRTLAGTAAPTQDDRDPRS